MFRSSPFAIFGLAPIVLAISLAAISSFSCAADKKQGGHGRGQSGGFNFFGVSPSGLTYGYADENFGLIVGPFGASGYGSGYGHAAGCRHPYPPYSPPVVERHYYQQPIVVQPASSPPRHSVRPARQNLAAIRPALIDSNSQASLYTQSAEQAFRQRRYEDALRDVTHALVEDQQNGRLLLLSAQVRFALGDYVGAEMDLLAATDLLEQADWGFVVQNYQEYYNNDDYVQQMKRLVEFNKENDNLAFPRVLRGYHYYFLGHQDSARKQLYWALDRDPANTLARRLLALAGEELPVPAPNPDDQ